MPTTGARGCLSVENAPIAEVVTGWKQSSGGGGQPRQSVVLARCAAETGREGKSGGAGKARGTCGNVEHSWAGQAGLRPPPRFGEAWAPDVSAGREGRGGESCQQTQAATLGAWPRAESLPGPCLPLHCSLVHTVGASYVSLSGLVAGWRAPAGPIRILRFPLALSGKVTTPTQLCTVCSAPGHRDVGSDP